MKISNQLITTNPNKHNASSKNPNFGMHVEIDALAREDLKKVIDKFDILPENKIDAYYSITDYLKQKNRGIDKFFRKIMDDKGGFFYKKEPEDVITHYDYAPMNFLNFQVSGINGKTPMKVSVKAKIDSDEKIGVAEGANEISVGIMKFIKLAKKAIDDAMEKVANASLENSTKYKKRVATLEIAEKDPQAGWERAY